MAKGYWIARMDVNDVERYQDYVTGAATAFAKYKPKFLVRGGDVSELEGKSRTRNVVIEFESVEQAHACYNEPEYQAAKAIRNSVADGELIIVEGHDG
ncbi:MAG: DUF1330 domain-containing protein [Hyphomicrobiales bacterium]